MTTKREKESVPLRGTEEKEIDDRLADLLAYVCLCTGEYHFDHVARLVSAALELPCSPQELETWQKTHPAVMKRAFRRVRRREGETVM